MTGGILRTQRGRSLLFAVAYFSEGAPIGFLWWALPTMLREGGVPVETAAALAGTLTLPWVLKFLWAPLIDSLRFPRWSYREWVLLLQAGMGVSLVPLLFLDPVADLQTVVPLLVIHALFAASQDTAIDAMAISVVPVEERGRINGWMQAGMLAGRSLFGGGALLAGALLHPSMTVIALIAAVWSSAAMLLASTPRSAGVDSPGFAQGLRRFAAGAREAASHRATWLGVAFALFGGLAFEGVGIVAGPLLLDRGWSPAGVGAFLGGPTVAAMLLGAVAGGYLADRWGARRVAQATLPLMAILATSIGASTLPGAGPAFVTAGLMVILYLGIGVFTASSFAIFMNLTTPAVGATQFSAYMGATNACESAAAFSVSVLSPLGGYAGAFTALSLLSFLGLAALRGIPRHRDDRLN